MNKQSSTPTSQRTIESQSIYAAMYGGGLGFAIGLILFWGGDVSLFERGLSLGFVGSILGGIIALVTYMVAVSQHERVSSSKQISTWRAVSRRIGEWSLALVHGLLVFLGYALMFYIVRESFIGARLDVWSASPILALAAGMSAYTVYLSAATMTAVRISMLLAMFLLAGVFISMLTAGDPEWWVLHFSSLGAGGGLSGYTFNATLIIAGLVIVALSRYIVEDFTKLQGQGQLSPAAKAGIMQVSLAGIGISLAFVGLFVYDAYPFLHNTSAAAMGVLFLVLVTSLRWVTPGFPVAFFIASYALLVGMFISLWLYASVGYFNLTSFELIVAAIIFTWLVVFVRHVAAMLEDQSNLPKKAVAAKAQRL